MSCTIGYIGYQVQRCTFRITLNSIYRLDHHLYQVNVLPFVETTDVVSLCRFSFMKNQVDGTGMVFHIKPVTHIFPLAIHRQWLSVTDVVDGQWYQFFGKLIRAIVVRTIGYNSRHTISVMISTYKMFATSLGIFVEELGSVS